MYLFHECILDRSVNRKLMEHRAEDGFRHIPFRLYIPQLTSKPSVQYLAKPIKMKENWLEDLLQKTNFNYNLMVRLYTFVQVSFIYLIFLNYLSKTISSHHSWDWHPSWNTSSVDKWTFKLSDNLLHIFIRYCKT